MKCPLSIRTEYALPEGIIAHGADCLKEGCAWWDEEKNACSVKVIAKELTRIQLKGGINHV